MSMPSSRLLVATNAGSRPALSSSSISRRCSLAMLPWWARTRSSPASSLRRCASRSLRRRLFVKTIVLLWLRISSRIRGWIDGQMLVRRSGLIAGPPGCCSCGSTSPMAAMSSTGTTTSSSSGFREPASTIVTSRSGPMPPRKRAIVSSGRWVADKPIRWGGFVRSGSRRCSRRSKRQREVGAAFGAGDRVDLVDDHVLDVAQDLAGLAREQQVQALGSRDEDVGRTAGDLATVLAGRVAGPARDGDPGRLVAELLRGQADPGQRRSQVALDVVCQGLQRRDVEDPDVAGVLSCCRRAGVAGQAVQRVEEGGEGLAAAGRGVDQRVIAPGDGRPAARLGLGRRLEARFEPCPNGGREGCERIGDDGSLPRTSEYRA